MIELYRPVDCVESDKFEAHLKEMVVAHKVITVREEAYPTDLPTGTSLPAVQDEGRLITGQAEIAAHLKELDRFVKEWRKYQMDACYIHEGGELSC